MNNQFDQVNNRKNTNSLKWNVSDNELPMWVADMDFKTAPEITEAIINRASQGIYGYNIIPDEWYASYQSWWNKRHDFFIERSWLIFCTGVVPALTCAVKRLTNVGDNVVVQTPVYDIFFHSIENHGRHVLENQLVYEDESYHIDFIDLEKKLSDPLTTMMILCNPHNPIGKVWSKNELEQIGILCCKYGVVVVSDEIHCDITDPGTKYVPFASVSQTCRQNSISLLSATKTFNLAGLQTAAVCAPSEQLYQKMERGLNADEIAEPNTFAIDSVVAAFTKGERWLNELTHYIQHNKQLVNQFLNDHLPQIQCIQSEATYLLWIDCQEILGDCDELCQFIRSQTGLYVLPGTKYRGNGNHFIRMNIACPQSILLQGLKLLEQGISAYEK